MGPIDSPCSNLISFLSSSSTIVSLCITLCKLWLQLHATGTTRHQSGCSQCSWHMCIIRPSWQSGLIDTLLAGTNKQIWLKSLTNEIGHCSIGLSKLCKPCDVIKGNNTELFVKPKQVPPNHKVTYCNFVCSMSPNMSGVYRDRMTVGGDHLDVYMSILLRSAHWMLNST